MTRYKTISSSNTRFSCSGGISGITLRFFGRLKETYMVFLENSSKVYTERVNGTESFATIATKARLPPMRINGMKRYVTIANETTKYEVAFLRQKRGVLPPVMPPNREVMPPMAKTKEVTPMFPKIYYGTTPCLSQRDKARFDHGDYRCTDLFMTADKKPVVVARNARNDIWKVQYGFSSILFADRASALDFCRERFQRGA